MKTTENKKTIALVDRLSEIIESRKSLETEEREIKSQLKNLMSELDTSILNVGKYVAIISNRVRTDLDKEMVATLLGDKYKDCLKKSEYQIFEVKKA